MASVTVRQFAEVLKVPVERLLGQLREAGLAHKEGEDRISEEEKVQLLDHLRGRRGKPASTEEPAAHPITLKRKTVSEISVSAEKKAPSTASRRLPHEGMKNTQPSAMPQARKLKPRKTLRNAANSCTPSNWTSHEPPT